MSLEAIFLIGAAMLIVSCIAREDCPEEYLRLSDRHSYCQPPNSRCQVIYSGVTEEDQKVILDTHNTFRSKIAIGEDEDYDDDLSTAANMLQMVWDEELAAVAQKYAMQCKFDHDCNDCRSIGSFNVGQNLGEESTSCDTRNCDGEDDEDKKSPNWKEIIQSFYGERKYSDASMIDSYSFNSRCGHFSQLIWAKTWRIGCGYVVYLNGRGYLSRLFVCNYGPSGNFMREPIYEVGSPCSACPLESCCGDTCEGGEKYPGLCRLDDPQNEPIWKAGKSDKKVIFDCKFSKNSSCKFGIKGKRNWKIHSKSFNPSALIILEGGESTAMDFFLPIEPKGKFCLVFVLRKGSNVAGEQDSNTLKAEIKQSGYDPWTVDVGMKTKNFSPHSLSCSHADTKFSLTFSVPDDAPAQYLEIKRIFAYHGECKD